MTNRVSQVLGEVAYTPDPTLNKARVSQVMAEVVITAPAAAHKYWRIEPRSPTNYYIKIAEIEMRESIGGADVCADGVASASSTWAANVPANAFDNNNSTYWESGVAGSGHWIQYAFPDPKAIVEVVIRNGDAGAEILDEFDVRYSDDGVTWTHVRLMDASNLGVNETERFSLYGTKTYWRIYVTASVNSPYYAYIAEFGVHTSVGGADVTTGAGGTPAASTTFSGSFLAANAFDDNITTEWSSGINTVPPHWLRYHFTDEIDAVEFTVQATDDSLYAVDYSPMDFLFQYSGDGINWTTLYTISGEVDWGVSEERTYPSSPSGGGAQVVMITVPVRILTRT